MTLDTSMIFDYYIIAVYWNRLNWHVISLVKIHYNLQCLM